MRPPALSAASGLAPTYRLDGMTTLLGTFTVNGLRRSATLRGAASAMDLRGDTKRQYLFYRTPAQADLEAIRNDWRALGDQFRETMRETRTNR